VRPLEATKSHVYACERGVYDDKEPRARGFCVFALMPNSSFYFHSAFQVELFRLKENKSVIHRLGVRTMK